MTNILRVRKIGLVKEIDRDRADYLLKSLLKHAPSLSSAKNTVCITMMNFKHGKTFTKIKQLRPTYKNILVFFWYLLTSSDGEDSEK